jgi:hypothetical protein
MNQSGRFIVVLASILGALTVSCVAVGPHLGAPTNIRITEYVAHREPDPEACELYKPTVRQVEIFMNRAVIVSGFVHNEMYSHLGCFTRGTADFAGTAGKWEMDGGGTGWISFDESSILLIADPEMEENPQ